MPLAMAVHGGAGDTPPSLRSEHRKVVELALRAGREILQKGGLAVDAVVAAITILEDSPIFNAGYGAVLNEAGWVELDAGLMEGEALNIGSVAGVRDVRNPILLCRALLTKPPIFLVGEAASRLAAEAGLERVAPELLISPGRKALWERGMRGPILDTGVVADTVGAVALDGKGNLAAGTSTGGISGKPVGRVGDSPLPGGGFYAENGRGACSTTGWGESLARLVTARRVIEQVERGSSVAEAARSTIRLLGERIRGGSGGVIAVDGNGRVGVAFNTPSMTYAWWSEVEGSDSAA